MRLVIICPHTKLLQYYWSDSLCYLYMRPPWLIYFITKDLIPWIPFTYFIPSCPTLLPSGNLPICSLWVLVFISVCFVFFSVQFSHSVMSDFLWTHALQHTRLPCPSPTLGDGSNSCPSSWWCHSTILSSVIPFSSHLQSFPASGSFQMCQLFTSGGQNIGFSASTSVLPINIQDRFPLRWTGWISLQSKGLSRVFSNTAVQNHQFFCTKLSL